MNFHASSAHIAFLTSLSINPHLFTVKFTPIHHSGATAHTRHSYIHHDIPLPSHIRSPTPCTPYAATFPIPNSALIFVGFSSFPLFGLRATQMALKTQPKSPGTTKKVVAASSSTAAAASAAAAATPKSPAATKKAAPPKNTKQQEPTAAVVESAAAPAAAPAAAKVAPKEELIDGEAMEAYRLARENPEAGSMQWMMNKFADILKRWTVRKFKS